MLRAAISAPADTDAARSRRAASGLPAQAGSVAARRSRAVADPASVLFLAMFAAQAGLIALTPVLTEVAAEFEVSTATAGQLRTVSGLAAGVAALAVSRAANRLGLRRLLLGGSGLLAAGSAGSAAAPTFEALAAAQVAAGIAIAALVTAGTAAAAEWAPQGQRARVLSRTLIGQPAAWIVGMPVLGALGQFGWRVGLLAVPLIASLTAGLALARKPVDRPPSAAPETRLRRVLADRLRARWALSELLANAAWAGTLVYAGALFRESYGTSPTATGLALALGAAVYVAGTVAFRGRADAELLPMLVRLPLLLAVLVTLFGAVRPSPAVSVLFFSVTAFVAGGRTLLGNAFGLAVAPRLRLTMIGTRTAGTQFGYFLGTALAGAALAAGGYGALGAALGVLFLAATVALAGAGGQRVSAPSTRGPSGSPRR